MLTTARKALLLDRLERDGQLIVTPLAIELGLSEDTLRRDLRDLASAGKLVRVHGGALPASPTHLPLAARRGLHEAEKAALAEAAARLINDGQIVIVDGGTTHLNLAAAIPQTRQCSIVTHSPSVAASFELHPKIDIILMGGRLFRHSMVALGPETARAYGRMKVDLCLLGVTGVHPEIGLTTGDSDEAELKRMLIEAAGETVVLATSDKLGRVSPWGIAPLAQVSILVTSDKRPAWLPDKTQHIQAR
ncbi:MAG: DeoR/GlpR family DNA-binding transcription regulator [Paracoccus sp. (in: a-proteobacteria)]|uniref:DeoR/GlpR family DNA-binding transcription regulator n=1 Tax=Paracoccus sp. TaxID=267 RepID=UPI0039E33E74